MRNNLRRMTLVLSSAGFWKEANSGTGPWTRLKDHTGKHPEQILALEQSVCYTAALTEILPRKPLFSEAESGSDRFFRAFVALGRNDSAEAKARCLQAKQKRF